MEHADADRPRLLDSKPNREQLKTDEAGARGSTSRTACLEQPAEIQTDSMESRTRRGRRPRNLNHRRRQILRAAPCGDSSGRWLRCEEQNFPASCATGPQGLEREDSSRRFRAEYKGVALASPKSGED